MLLKSGNHSENGISHSEKSGRRTAQMKTGQVNLDYLTGHFRGHFCGPTCGATGGPTRGSRFAFACSVRRPESLSAFRELLREYPGTPGVSIVPPPATASISAGWSEWNRFELLDRVSILSTSCDHSLVPVHRDFSDGGQAGQLSIDQLPNVEKDGRENKTEAIVEFDWRGREGG